MSDAAKTVPAGESGAEKAFEAELREFFGGSWGVRRKTVEMPAPQLETLKAKCKEEV